MTSSNMTISRLNFVLGIKYYFLENLTKKHFELYMKQHKYIKAEILQKCRRVVSEVSIFVSNPVRDIYTICNV